MRAQPAEAGSWRWLWPHVAALSIIERPRPPHQGQLLALDLARRGLNGQNCRFANVRDGLTPL